MLLERLDKKLDSLLEKYDEYDNELSLEFLNELKGFYEEVLEDYINLKKSGDERLAEYISQVYKGEDFVEDVKKKIVYYKSCIEKTTRPNVSEITKSVFTLTDEQKEEIKRFCLDIKEFIEQAKSKVEDKETIGDSLDLYQGIIDSIRDNKDLDIEELGVISDLVDDADTKAKLHLLKDFAIHNVNVQKRSEIKISADELLFKLKEYKVNPRTITQCKNIISELPTLLVGMDIIEIDNILKFYQNHDMLHKFKDGDELLFILNKASLKTVTAAYEDFINKGLLDKGIIYESGGLWIEQIQTDERVVRRRGAGKKSGGKTSTSSLRYEPCKMTRKDLMEKIAYYNSLGIDPFAKKVNKKGELVDAYSSNLLLKSLYSMKRNEAIAEKYRINYRDKNGEAQGSYFLLSGNVIEKCDKLIECGLLNPSIKNQINEHNVSFFTEDELRSTYINNYFTALLNYQENKIALMQWKISEGKYDELFSSRNTLIPQLAKKDIDSELDRNDLTIGRNSKVRYSREEKEELQEKIDSFVDSKGLFILGEKNISRFDDMLQVNSDYDKLVYKAETYGSPFIKELDDKYLVDGTDYLYDINGQRISRYKVLRLYEGLNEYNRNNPDTSFEEKDMRLFSVAYGKYMKKNSFEQLQTDINSLGGRSL